MFQKFGYVHKNKLIWLVLVGWVLVACNPPATTITETSIPEVATKIFPPTLSPTLLPSTPDIQKIPTITLVSSPTPVIQSGPTLDIRAWNSEAEQYDLIAIADRGEYNQILLFSPNSQIEEVLHFPNGISPLGVEQVMDNCDLVILTRTKEGHKLVRINRAGEVKQEIFLLKFDRANEQRFLPRLSQTGKYVAYVVFSGEIYYDSAQYQDIEMVELGKTKQPTRLTSHGGAWGDGGVWSPVGAKIAYTDYDENGILQVYIAEIVGGNINRKVISKFKEPGGKAGPISWSPNGNQLTVILRDDNGWYTNSAWVIPTDGSDDAFKLDLPGGKISAIEPYWSADGSKLLFEIVGDNSKDVTGLYWFNVENNKLLHVLSLNNASQISPEADYFTDVFPLTTDLSKVIFRNGRIRWSLYDVARQQIEDVPWLNQHEMGIYLDISLFSKDIPTCKP